MNTVHPCLHASMPQRHAHSQAATTTYLYVHAHYGSVGIYICGWNHLVLLLHDSMYNYGESNTWLATWLLSVPGGALQLLDSLYPECMAKWFGISLS